MKLRSFDQRRWLSAIVILSLGVGSMVLFHRNYHFSFDSHHLYDDATFFQWTAGWFGDFDRGPLSATIVEGPKVANGNFERKTYRWYLKRRFPKAEIIAWIDDPGSLRFALVRLPGSRKLLLHCWSGGSWDTFKYRIIARHVGNQESQFERLTDQVYCSINAYSMVAWQRNRIEFENDFYRGINIGNQMTLPGSEPVEDWAFHFSTQGKRQNGDRFFGEFVVGFDSATGEWRIFDRDWHEMEGINSWINEEKRFAEPALPPGFSF